MRSISDCWRQFKKHLPKNGELPDGVGVRRRPNGSDPFQSAEEVLGAKLSPAFREFFGEHNGTGPILIFPFEIGNGEHNIYSLEDTLQQLQRRREAYADGPSEPYGGPDWTPPPEVKGVCWHDQWLPLTDNGCGDGLFLDYSPQSCGTPEQVVDWSHEGAVTVLLANGLIEWFNDVVNKLESGDYQLAVAI